ncbi:MAG: hypothetical protein GX543_07800 [Gordonia sp.]|nr:hypothetical protein [Gordonia sp. (in: high G+C Gram-positive bacteria)]
MNVLSLPSDVVMFLADEPAREPEFGKASPVGLLVILILLVGVFLLIRSMNKQLKKLPESFDTENPEPDQAFDEGTDRADADPVAKLQKEAGTENGTGGEGHRDGEPTDRG